MIRIAEARLKHYVPGLTTAGNQLIRVGDAEMHLAEENGLLLIQQLKEPFKQFVLHVSATEYMLPAERIEGVFAGELPVVPGPVKIVEVLSREESKGALAKPIPTPIAEDTIRMVKIKGKIVERKGPPQDDELEELTKPRGKSVAAMIAEADGAPAAE